MSEAAASAESLYLQAAQICEVGGRSTNQDALLKAHHGPLSCFVVADGAGGHTGGALAAKLVTESLVTGFIDAPACNQHALRSYLSLCCTSVESAQLQNTELKAMSSTVVALLIDQQQARAIWGHLGDSRLYLFRDKKILAITLDHSLVQQYITMGYCDASQSRTHPQRNVLYAAAGACDETLPEVCEHSVAVQPGDAFLLCTDGLWEWVLESEMESTLATAPDAHSWLENMQMIASQRNAGSTTVRDNTSAFAIWLSSGE